MNIEPVLATPAAPTIAWQTTLWPLAGIGAVALPVLFVPTFPPSPTLFNEALALFGWGVLLALMTSSLAPVRAIWPTGLKVLMSTFALVLGADRVCAARVCAD